jgi:hypothetical protein
MTMSLLQKTDVYQSQKERTAHNPEYGFVLALIGAALALIVASAIFAPAPIGSGISSDIVLVGP